MRGQGQCTAPGHGGGRITPADAGTSLICGFALGNREDHPRGCGDKQLCYLDAHDASGSPPRMRGQADWCSMIYPRLRITPADAGTSCHRKFREWMKTDHPRGCGDKVVPSDGAASRLGSPPRMRGQADSMRFVVWFSGITPADAGTSLNNPFM